MKKCSKCGICGADAGMEVGMDCRFENETNDAVSRANTKEENKMLDLTKIYTAKASATRALNKATKDGGIEAADYTVSPVDGGFQIILIHETGPMEFCDEELEAKYAELANVKLNNTPAGDAIAENCFIFTAGMLTSEIDAWFDGEYSEGLEALKCKLSNDNGGGSNGNDGSESGKPEITNENAESANEPPSPANENAAKADEKPAAAKADTLTDQHKSALNALAGVKILAEKSEAERAGIWFPFAEIYNSTTPADLPKRSMGGIMRALINRGFVQFLPDGKEVIGKKSVAVCFTNEGLLALQS